MAGKQGGKTRRANDVRKATRKAAWLRGRARKEQRRAAQTTAHARNVRDQASPWQAQQAARLARRTHA